MKVTRTSLSGGMLVVLASLMILILGFVLSQVSKSRPGAPTFLFTSLCSFELGARHGVRRSHVFVQLFASGYHRFSADRGGYRGIHHKLSQPVRAAIQS